MEKQRLATCCRAWPGLKRLSDRSLPWFNAGVCAKRRNGPYFCPAAAADAGSSTENSFRAQVAEFAAGRLAFPGQDADLAGGHYTGSVRRAAGRRNDAAT